MRFLSPLILSLYLTGFIYNNAFFVKRLVFVDKGNQLFFNELGIFVIFLIPIFFIMKRIVITHNTRGVGGMLRTAILTIGLLGLVMSFLYHVVPIDGIYHFPAIV